MSPSESEGKAGAGPLRQGWILYTQTSFSGLHLYEELLEKQAEDILVLSRAPNKTRLNTIKENKIGLLDDTATSLLLLRSRDHVKTLIFGFLA